MSSQIERIPASSGGESEERILPRFAVFFRP